jgi:hypothetical protein
MAPSDVAATRALPHWQISLGLLGGYDSNVDFSAANRSDYGATLRASATRNIQGPRSHFSLSIGGAGYKYFEETTADHVDGSLSLVWTQELSRRNSFHLSGYGAYQNTSTQAALPEGGTPLPRSPSQSYEGSTGFNFKVGRYGWLRLDGRYFRVTYENTRLVDSQSWGGVFAVGRHIGPHDDLSLSFAYLRTEDEKQPGLDAYYGALDWTRILSRHLMLTAAGGAGYNPPVADGISRTWYPYASLGLRGTWRRTTLFAEARQSVTSAYGLGGNQIAVVGSLTATFPIGKSVSVVAGGSVTWGRERSAAAPPYVGEQGNLSLNWRLFRYAGLGLGYTYRRTDPEGGPALQANRVSFGFTYTRP